ncbi:MAG: N-6 DNA methylase [Actinomycetota bacterium]|nr:N-6 DNA methylase [Actinomycetota bacterium]
MISSHGTHPLTEPEPAETDPWSIVLGHEQQASPTERKRRGAWYTPRSLVDALVRLTFDGLDEAPELVLDPSCGGGGFLLGVLDRLVADGASPEVALRRVAGIDIDASAIAAARRAIGAWARGHDLPSSAVTGVRLGTADALDGLPSAWPRPSIVIGNPPFASPLRGGSFPERAHEARREDGDLLGPYSDLAALHLLAAVRSCAPHGRVCLILPQSLLAGRDSAGLRAWLDIAAPPTAVWISSVGQFRASVNVWAPVLAVGGERGPVRVVATSLPEPRSVAPGAWPELAAEALGIPNPGIDGDRAILFGTLATATAGFRDEYYGIAAACRESDDADRGALRIVTSGSLHPLSCSWGRKEITLAKRRWSRPVADRPAFDGALGRWVEQQCRPKLVLPTQSRVFEPVIDTVGNLLPVTPVLSINAQPEVLGRLAAVLLAPPVVAWAHRRWCGTALSVGAMKLAAKDLALLPLPPSARQGTARRWDQAAELALGIDPFDVDATPLRETLETIGRLMTEAYGAPESLFDWWSSRLHPVG